MRICGVDYRGQDLIPVVLETDDDGQRLVATEPKRIELDDLFDTAKVRSFARTVAAFLRDNGVDVVVVKKRATKGRFAGGPTSFRMGGVLQLSTEKPVEFLSGPSITAALKDADEPEGEVLAYQKTALDVARAFVAKRLG